MMTLGMMQRGRRSERASQRNIKALLANSSPTNPTYILAVVLEDFTSQGFTELAVKKGDEIYVMYEIDEWAYVACLTETSLRGYIPLDYCLPVQDFFYDNPALNRKLLQNGTKAMPSKEGQQKTVTSRQSRRALEPIEGSEMAPAEEHQYHRLNHVTVTSGATLPRQKRNGNPQRPPQQSRTVRRSHTITSTSKPTVSFQLDVQNGSRKVPPAVPKKPVTSPVVNTPINSRLRSTEVEVDLPLPSTVKATPVNLQQQTTTHRTHNALSTGTAQAATRARKNWSHHIMDDHRRSSSLETVDEISELDESLTSGATGSGGIQGIQRLISKFQSRIKDEHKDLTGAVPRLSSLDSVASSVSEDNDSVFTDNEESVQSLGCSNGFNPSTVTSEEDLSTARVEHDSLENKLNKLQPLGKSTPNNLDVSSSPIDDNTSCDDNLIVNKPSAPELENKIDNSAVLDLSTIESITSSSLVENDAAHEGFLDDSLLDPPMSFSSSLSETAADAIATSTQHSHCCCCVHYLGGQQNISATGKSVREKLEPISFAEVEAKDHADSEVNRRMDKSTHMTNASSSNYGVTIQAESKVLERKKMCDGSTQTAQEVANVGTGKRQTHTRKFNSTFSRNSKLRQSNLCTESTNIQHAPQSIPPANLTNSRLAAHNPDLTERNKQQRSVML